ncbi:unnamed protein product [Sympodiomycopsis kandeliae]
MLANRLFSATATRKGTSFCNILPARMSSTSIPAASGTWRNTKLSSIRHGPGCLKTALNSALEEDLHGKSRALVVTGKSLNTKTDVIAKVKEALGSKYIATLDEIGQHAPVEGIHKAVDLVEREKIDVLISVGGGSPIDSSKAISYFVHEKLHGKEDADERNYIPSIAIPTTLSVAETTQNAGFTKDGKKTGVSHPALVPRVIILDAELTQSTPERLWLSSGMRAVDHAIESLYRPGDFNHLLKHMYLGSIKDLFALLRASKQDPQNIKIRQALQVAAINSLFPEARRGALGLSHGLGHALGSTYSIPHGITSCLTLSSAIKLTAQLETTPVQQLSTLSEALSYIDSKTYPFTSPSDESDVETLRQRGVKVGDEVNNLIHDLGLNTSLDEWKVPREDYETIAQHVSAKDESLTPKVVKLLEGIRNPLPRL